MVTPGRRAVPLRAGGLGDSCPYNVVSCSSLIFFFLRYNSHIIKPTILKSTIQWFLKYSRGCATIPTIKFQSIFITPKRNSYPLAVPPYPPSLQRSDFSLLFAASFPWYRLRPVSGPLEPQGWNVVEGRDLGIRDRHLLAVRFWGSA